MRGSVTIYPVFGCIARTWLGAQPCKGRRHKQAPRGIE
jgi:hypothetical protein